MEKVKIILFYLLITLSPYLAIAQDIVYNFDKSSDLNNWIIVNDDVMGGVSKSNVYINDDSHCVFTGFVSTANNGGFCSLRYYLKRKKVNNNEDLKLRVKGDGKPYQLRIKSNRNDYFSYVFSFETSGDWQTISVPLKEMFPSFRGRRLNLQNFSNKYFEEIGILVGNKRNEKFSIIIDKIYLK